MLIVPDFHHLDLSGLQLLQPTAEWHFYFTLKALICKNPDTIRTESAMCNSDSSDLFEVSPSSFVQVHIQPKAIKK